LSKTGARFTEDLALKFIVLFTNRKPSCVYWNVQHHIELAPVLNHYPNINFIITAYLKVHDSDA